ncbi:MAG: sulfatase/phosphatase domain-containing protein, partial [Acetobacteraceae bacterium]
GRIETAFTESIDILPTIVDWLGGNIPRACDGRSLLPLVRGEKPADWRTELHYEYDFRDIYYSQPEAELGVGMDEASLCVVQDERFKYVHFAALPPLLFDLTADPHQFHNRVDDPAFSGVVRDYAQKALSWRLIHADRSLTGYRAAPGGLQDRGSRRT